MKFLLDNLYLFAIALVSGGLLVWPLIKRGGGATALSPLLATQLINHRNAVVVDVRDEKAYALGSLAGARNLPFATLKERAAELVRFKARPVLVVCDAGQDSARATAIFKEQGFEEAHSLAGGIGAWKTAGLPLVQPGRDSAKPAQKDRKPRNDRARSGGRPPRNANGVAVAAPVSATAAAPVADEATDAPDRLKEVS